jgi:RNA polymerase sigma-70 factor (ECF subfamily)
MTTEQAEARRPGGEYLNELYSYALVVTLNHAEAEDLIQETYFRAMRAMERLRLDSNIKGRLLTILRNVWLNRLRRRRNGPEMVQMELCDGVVTDVVQASKGPHNLYVDKMEAGHPRATHRADSHFYYVKPSYRRNDSSGK